MQYKCIIRKIFLALRNGIVFVRSDQYNCVIKLFASLCKLAENFEPHFAAVVKRVGLFIESVRTS